MGQDAGRRAAALEAAAWTRQGWLLDALRARAARPAPEDLDALRLLAVLAPPADLPRIRAVGEAAALGPARFDVLAAFGSPALVPALLEGMRSEDAETAAAAGAAYQRITGMDVESGTRARVVPAGAPEPDAFEREFLDEVALPDPAKAAAHWDAVRKDFETGTRWCAGIDLGAAGAPPADARLGLGVRREAALRAAFHGAAGVRLADLERFPR